MTGRDQTPREVSVVNLDRSTFLLAPRQLLRVGAWNVRTMYAEGHTEQVAREFRRMKLELLGISESRWTREGEERLETGEIVLYSGKQDNQHHQGTALMLG